MIGAIGFLAPWLLLAAFALPVLWFLLRAIPPAPLIQRFPGIALLIGLKDEDAETARTPWWLLLLRISAVFLLIVGFASPVLNPNVDDKANIPLLVVMEGSWAEAPTWNVRRERAVAALQSGYRNRRKTAFINLSSGVDEEQIAFAQTTSALEAARVSEPTPWQPNYELLANIRAEGSFEVLWLASPVKYEDQSDAMVQLLANGPVKAAFFDDPIVALSDVRLDGSEIIVEASGVNLTQPSSFAVLALGDGPDGAEVVLDRQQLVLDAGASQGEIVMNLPAELRSRISRFEIESQPHAGATHLTDGSLRRPEVGLYSGAARVQEGAALLTLLHYPRQAFEGRADLVEGTLGDILQANPDALILADVAEVPNFAAIYSWVEDGGRLIRFAGPRLAAAEVDRLEADPLMPVSIRAGGRTLGGAMSWGQPKTLLPFKEGSPFFGLNLPDDIQVRAQVLAQPGPDLPNRVIAQLEDGTPLVTLRKVGLGSVALFHVTANTEWSNLPISGLFVDMLIRLTSGSQITDLANLPDTAMAQLQVRIEADGTISSVETQPGIPVQDILQGSLSAKVPPGVYDGEEITLARNVLAADQMLQPASFPDGVRFEADGTIPETPLMHYFLVGALALFVLDALATLWMSGRLRKVVRVAPILLMGLMLSNEVDAQTDDQSAIELTSEIVFGYILTGDARVDEISHAGISGLSDVLFARTSVEPVAPVGIDLATAELSFFPLIYWPITSDQTLPSDDAVARLNRYLKSGGMILFDTKDGNVAGLGQGITDEGRKLQEIAQRLELPRLEPIPEDHVLTRSFYLLQDFPGRHYGSRVWVEASPVGQQSSTTGFRNLNDGVSPVVIGGNDWAAAWAMDSLGRPMFPIGQGFQGERQRELAARFGVNLVMYVLTGNYKSDQVHVSDILERMGQ